MPEFSNEDKLKPLGLLAQQVAEKISKLGCVSYTGRVLVPQGAEDLSLRVLFDTGCLEHQGDRKGRLVEYLLPELSIFGRLSSRLERSKPGRVLINIIYGFRLPDNYKMLQIYNQNVYDLNTDVRRGLRKVKRFDANGSVDQ